MSLFVNRENNEQTLREFTAYCQAHPEQHFWEALCKWSGATMIYWMKLVTENGVSFEGPHQPTFWWKGRNGT